MSGTSQSRKDERVELGVLYFLELATAVGTMALTHYDEMDPHDRLTYVVVITILNVPRVHWTWNHTRPFLTADGFLLCAALLAGLRMIVLGAAVDFGETLPRFFEDLPLLFVPIVRLCAAYGFLMFLYPWYRKANEDATAPWYRGWNWLAVHLAMVLCGSVYTIVPAIFTLPYTIAWSWQDV